MKQNEEPKRRTSYDSAYKLLFSNKKIVHQLLTRFIPEAFIENVKLEDIEEQVKSSFVTEDFKQLHSDLIYKIRLNGREVYVLIEFQSTPDPDMPIRLGEYILQLCRRVRQEREQANVPSVLPIVLYNGTQKWNMPLGTSEFIERVVPDSLLRLYKHIFLDVMRIPKEVLRKIKGALAAVFYLEQMKDPKALTEGIDELLDLIRDEDPELLRLVMRLITEVYRGIFKQEDIDKLTEATEVKTMFAQLREGIDQDIERSRKKGMEQKARETALNMLAMGSSIDFIHKATGLTTEEIQELRSSSMNGALGNTQ